MQNLRRILKQPMSQAMPMKMADGGRGLRGMCFADGGVIDPLKPGIVSPVAAPATNAGGWQARQDLANAQTGASSIVAGQARTNAQAQVKSLTPVAQPPAPGIPGAPGGIPKAPGGIPGVTPTSSLGSPPSSNVTNTYTSAPAPATPVAGGPITRVGNSFSNVTPPNESSAYAPAFSLGMEGNRSPMGLRNGGELYMARGGPSMQPHAYGLGGPVEGKDQGHDTINSKYRPGEYVASVEMLNAAPGLREQLDGLRNNVLAKQGITPEQADAKAMGSGTLRAQNAFGGSDLTEALRRVGSLDLNSPPLPVQQQAAPPMAKAPALRTGMGLVPMQQSAAPTTAMGQAFEAAKSQRSWAPSGPAPVVNAPNLPFAEGPFKDNRINFNTAPEIKPINATTSMGASAPPPFWTPAPAPAASPSLRSAGGPPALVPALAEPVRQNFTAGKPSMPSYTPPLGIGGTPANAVAVQNRPNFTMPEAGVFGQGTSNRGFDNSGAQDATARSSTAAARAAAEAAHGERVNPTAPPTAPGAAAAPPVAAAPAAPMPPPEPGLRGALNRATGGISSGLSTASKFLGNSIPVLTTAAGAAEGQLNVGKILTDKDSTGMDVAAQQAHEVGRLGAAGSGAALGGFIGAGLGIPTGPGSLATGMAGTALGGYLGGKAYDMFKKSAADLSGGDGNTPLDRLSERKAVAAAAPDQSNPADQRLAAGTQTTPTSAPIQLRSAPAAAVAPTAPGMNPREVMAMNNRMADEMHAERMAAEEAARPMPGPKSSANDWQARNALRNMEVSASSITGTQKERLQRQAAFQQAQGHDFAMMSGADPATLAGIKARADMAQNSTTRRGQDLTERNNVRTNATTLRGHELDYEGKLAPAKLAAANRDIIMRAMGHPSVGNDPARGAAALTAAGRPDLAKDLQTQADASLKMAAESDALVKNKWSDMEGHFKGQYLNPDKNGTPEANAGLEARAFARLKRTQPEAYNLSPTKRAEASRNAMSDEELMGAFGNPSDAGFASLIPAFISQNRLDDRTTEIPGNDKLRGTTISDRVGGLRGAVSPGNLESGDYMLRTPAGRSTTNLGKLSGDAKARLQWHIDNANASPQK